MPQLSQCQLALRYQPHIYEDRAEPFPIRCIGWQVFEKPGMSESFEKLYLEPVAAGADFIIEYAVYYDYDIQHLYDLEHIWVAAGESGEVMDCWCSFHGMRLRAAGYPTFRTEGTHPILYAQPGKHAMAPDPVIFFLHPDFETACSSEAGGGLLISPMLRDKLRTCESLDRKICSYIRTNFQFQPALEYTRVQLTEDQFLPVPELLERIPAMIERQLERIQWGLRT